MNNRYTKFWSVLFICILAHELAHFFFGNLFGAKIEVFSIGFGYREWSWVIGTWEGTEYRLSPILLGGYNKFASSQFEGYLLTPSYFSTLFILASGSLTNLAMSLLTPRSEEGTWLEMFRKINWELFFFNLIIPIPITDGGKIYGITFQALGLDFETAAWCVTGLFAIYFVSLWRKK